MNPKLILHEVIRVFGAAEKGRWEKRNCTELHGTQDGALKRRFARLRHLMESGAGLTGVRIRRFGKTWLVLSEDCPI